MEPKKTEARPGKRGLSDAEKFEAVYQILKKDAYPLN